MAMSDLTSYIDIDLNVTHINLVLEKVCPRGWTRAEANGRPFHGLVYVLGGMAKYVFENKVLEVKKNDILFLHKNSKYNTIGSQTNPYSFIVVSFDLSEGQALPFHNSIKVEHDYIYVDMFRELENTWFNSSIGYKLKCKSILNNILYQIVHDVANQTVPLELFHKIEPAIAYIENNCNASITLEILAQLCGLSVTHFRRLFNKLYGISPQAYLNNIRINNAKQLINSNLYTIKEISELTGYCDIFYFSRAFKKMTGMSPSQYKKLSY